MTYLSFEQWLKQERKVHNIMSYESAKRIASRNFGTASKVCQEWVDSYGKYLHKFFQFPKPSQEPELEPEIKEYKKPEQKFIKITYDAHRGGKTSKLLEAWMKHAHDTWAWAPIYFNHNDFTRDESGDVPHEAINEIIEKRKDDGNDKNPKYLE